MLMQLRRTSMMLLAVAGVAIPAMSEGAAAQVADPWREVAGHHNYLAAHVAAVSPTSAFFAGSFGSRHITRFKQWDGHDWTNAPGIARPHSELHAIDAIGPDDAWAVGYQSSHDRTFRRTLLVHWDGARWAVVPGGGRGELYDVSMVSPDDVWAAGFDVVDHHARSVILHWDGSRWQQVRIPVAGIWVSVLALSSGDVWIGGYGPDGDAILHWDGHAWSSTPTSGFMNSIDALSPNDVWAVGENGSTLRTVIEHWDGTAWTVVPSPSPGENYGTFLQSVTAVSPDDVWAAGETGAPAAGFGVTVIEHWDGSEWSLVPSPNPGKKWNYLGAISADSTGDAWASGAFSNRKGVDLAKTLLLHWDGAAWTRLHDVR